MGEHRTGTDRLLVEVADGVGRIVLNDPERHNTISAEMVRALPRAASALDADPEVRAIVLTGAGERAFASGADIGEQSERVGGGDYSAAGTFFERIGGDVLIESAKPVIALIRGWCLGGGMLLALCADLRIATDDAQFAIPASRLGLAAPPQAAEILTANVGPTMAAEMLMLGDRIDAARALELGLVNRVVRAEEFESAAGELVDALAASAPLSVRAAKFTIAAHLGVSDRLDAVAADAAIADAFSSDDAREGTAAFMEKRTPRFRGR